MIKAIYSWKPISKMPIGRPKTRWEDDVRKDIQKLKVPNWKTPVWDRRRWKELVEKPKFYIKSCRAITRRRSRMKLCSILLLVANGHQNCIKCTNADIRLRTPDDRWKGCPKHVES
jgi:hypothetical protein